MLFLLTCTNYVQMSDDEFYLEDSSEDEEEEEEDGEGFEIDDGLQFSGEEGVDSVGGMQVAPPPTSYQTLTPDMISKKMFDIVHEVNAVFQVCAHLCPLLPGDGLSLSPSPSFPLPMCASSSPLASGTKRSCWKGNCHPPHTPQVLCTAQ